MLVASLLYRMGADTTTFEKKLVNWWAGLALLANGMSGSARIRDVVENSATPALSRISVINHLTAYVSPCAAAMRARSRHF